MNGKGEWRGKVTVAFMIGTVVTADSAGDRPSIQ